MFMDPYYCIPNTLPVWRNKCFNAPQCCQVRARLQVGLWVGWLATCHQYLMWKETMGAGPQQVQVFMDGEA